MTRFYKYIVCEKGKYHIIKDNEKFGSYRSVEDALYERDRLMSVNWDWDMSMELPETENKYLYMELPPFEHEPSHITVDKECWVVRGKGKNQEYIGRFSSFEEAQDVASLHSANISHKRKAFRVQKRIDGKTRYFGRYPTLKAAEAKVKEMESNNWENE